MTPALAWAALAILLSSDEAGRAGHWLLSEAWSAMGASSTISPPRQEELSWWLQKAIHVVVFGILGCLAGLPGRFRPARLWIGFLICLAAEAAQRWTSSRSAEVADALLNVAVFALAAGAAAWGRPQPSPESGGVISALADYSLCAAALLLASPLLALAAFAVWLEDGRPVLFRHRRIGRNGKPFEVLKLRSMTARGAGPEITTGNDSRITRVGRLLRRYKIDELPQLWNVLRGEMSLIGPRPEVERYVDLDDVRWREVLRRKPGITDVATLMFRNEEELLARAGDPERLYREVILPRKLALNCLFARRRSPLADLRLLLLTVRHSVRPSGFDASEIRRTFGLENLDEAQERTG